jgi:hypothetical protein
MDGLLKLQSYVQLDSVALIIKNSSVTAYSDSV